jgi:hypothetical protein
MTPDSRWRWPHRAAATHAHGGRPHDNAGALAFLLRAGVIG